MFPPLLAFSLFADAPKPPTEDLFVMPDEFEQPGRTKRSPIPSNKVGGLNVETLVVADKKMLEKHGRENVTTYVLTVMNMVSRTPTHTRLQPSGESKDRHKTALRLGSL